MRYDASITFRRHAGPGHGHGSGDRPPASRPQAETYDAPAVMEIDTPWPHLQPARRGRHRGGARLPMSPTPRL